MRYLVLTLILTFAFFSTALAGLDMDSKSFYAQGLVSLPSGSLGDITGTGYGAGAGMSVPFSPKMNFRGEFSYLWYEGKNYRNYEFNHTMIPIFVLSEYHLKAEGSFYLLGGLGLTIVNVTSESTGESSIVDSAENDATSTEFSAVLGGGFQASKKFKFEGRFNVVGRDNYLSVHGLYSF